MRVVMLVNRHPGNAVFDYTVEIYVPAAKRKYGYFVLPILWGDRFIGRLDAKANRTTHELVVHNLVFEPAFADWNAAKPIFLETLDRFAELQQCDTWKVVRIQPGAFKIGTGYAQRALRTRKPRPTP